MAIFPSPRCTVAKKTWHPVIQLLASFGHGSCRFQYVVCSVLAMSWGKWLGKHDVHITGAAKGNRRADKIFDHGPKKAGWVTTHNFLLLSFLKMPGFFDKFQQRALSPLVLVGWQICKPMYSAGTFCNSRGLCPSQPLPSWQVWPFAPTSMKQCQRAHR